MAAIVKGIWRVGGRGGVVADKRKVEDSRRSISRCDRNSLSASDCTGRKQDTDLN